VFSTLLSRKIIHKNLICAAFLSLGILLPDLFLGYGRILTCTIPTTTLLGVLGFSFLLSFVRNKWILFMIICLLIVTQTIQVNHWAYFGAPIHSQDIIKAFVELDEIIPTGISLAGRFWPVWLTLGVSTVCIISALICTKDRKRLAHVWLVVVLVLGITPALSYFKGPSFFYTKPTSSTIYNTVRAFSDWIIPKKKNKNLGYKPYNIIYGAPKVKNIIFIMGESLSSRYMHLYGYQKPNTPYLDSLKNNPNFVFAKGISSSVSTEICLQLFFNMMHNPGFIELIRKKDANLFRLAKHQGYKTFVVSGQNERLFHDTGTEFVDKFISIKDLQQELKDKGDEVLLNTLSEFEFEQKNFIVIHLRHVHEPYSDYSKYLPDPITHAGSDDNRLSQTQQHYSQAIGYHDYWVKQCVATIQKLFSQDTMILFASDHGELLGERGLFGHNQMQPEVADIPIWAFAINAHTQLLSSFKNKIISHYDLGKYIAELIGVKITNPNEEKTLQFVHGSEIFTDYEFMPWEKDNEKAVFLRNQWVSMIPVKN